MRWRFHGIWLWYHLEDMDQGQFFYNPVVTRKLNGWHPSIDSHPPDIRFPSTNTLSFWGITEKSIIRMVIYLGIIGHRKVTHKKGHVTGGPLLGLLTWYLLLIMKPQKAFKIIYRVGTYIYTHTHIYIYIYYGYEASIVSNGMWLLFYNLTWTAVEVKAHITKYIALFK